MTYPPGGGNRVDDHEEVATVVGCTALVVVLMAAIWLILSPDNPSGGEVTSGVASPQHQGPSDLMRRCGDADRTVELAARGGTSKPDLSGCVRALLGSTPRP